MPGVLSPHVVMDSGASLKPETMQQIGELVTSAISSLVNSVNTVTVKDDLANSGMVIVSYCCGKVLQSKLNDGRQRVQTPKMVELVVGMHKAGFAPYSISEQTGDGSNTLYVDFFSSKFKPDVDKKAVTVDEQEQQEPKAVEETQPALQDKNPQTKQESSLASMVRRVKVLSTAD
jgi:hypothetical protein